MFFYFILDSDVINNPNNNDLTSQAENSKQFPSQTPEDQSNNACHIGIQTDSNNDVTNLDDASLQRLNSFFEEVKN